MCPNNITKESDKIDEKYNENEGNIDVQTKHNNGCLWKGKFGDLTKHLDTDCISKQSVCQYVKIGCKHTDAMIKSELDIHYINHKNKHNNIIINNIGNILNKFDDNVMFASMFDT